MRRVRKVDKQVWLVRGLAAVFGTRLLTALGWPSLATAAVNATALNATASVTAHHRFAALFLCHPRLNALRNRCWFFCGRALGHTAFLTRFFLCKCGGKGSRCQQCSKGECLFHGFHSVERACTIVAASHKQAPARVGLNKVWHVA